MKLDKNITSPQERLKIVEDFLAENPNPGERYLEILANYLVYPIEKEERRKNYINTENRMCTVNERELSLEGLVSKLENGEDGLYGLMSDSKTIIFKPHVEITQKDLNEIPELREITVAIHSIEKQLKNASGHAAYVLGQTLTALRKDRYTIKDAFRKPIRFTKITRSKSSIKLDDSYSFDADGNLRPAGLSFADPAVCSAILCNYSRLKQDSIGHFDDDLWYFMESFDELCGRALADYPLYERIVLDKIDGLQNIEIQKDLINLFNTKHSLEYISSLWRNKIPSIIASAAEDDILYWHYLNVEKGKFKRCSKCGQVKLAHNKYFSKNKTSKDGFYSICKKCRNAKKK